MLVEPKRGSLKVHVNQHIIRQKGEKPITVRQGSKRFYARQVIITGPCAVVYSPDYPLDCGAKVWIETFDPVDVKE
jgi:hypothetical protein